MTSPVGPLLASGNVAEMFAFGEHHVLKLYKPAPWAKRVAFHEAANQASAEAMGLPVPALHGVLAQDGRWGVVSDRVAGSTFAERMLGDMALVPGHLAVLIDLQLRIQRVDAPFFTDVKRRLASHIGHAAALAPARQRALLDGLAAMPDGDRLCHLDFHPMNLLGPLDAPVVIDWVDACRGQPAVDACRAHVLLEIHAEPLAPAYLEGYCAAGRCRADELNAWRPFVLAAMLVETPTQTPRILALLAATGW
jgi:Ser/Thr protein kinase RdoA (MazF antagonist)